MTVYSDAHGVPQIVAETEASAWYALGFEHARDGLLWIQYCCRAARGQLSSVIGSKGLYNDLAAKILGAHLGGRPAAQQDAACVGPGLRSVFWYEETWNIQGPQPHVRDQGFQQKLLGMSGSYATLLALFPSTGGVESHFWCTPGVAAMNESFVPAPGVSRFEAHMNACATNTLMQSHYSDFTTNYVPPIVTHTSPY